MKKIYILPLLLMILATACKKDFLDRQPLAQISPDNFFKTETDLQLYINSLYSGLPSGPDIYSETADNIVRNALTPELTGLREVPVSGGGWDWTELRKVNYFLDNYNRVLDKKTTAKYVGVAKFFRALFYYNKVKTFGDVPWFSKALNPDDEQQLKKTRDPRTLVMDSVLNDINYAVDNLGTGKSSDQITKWTALALKSRICLFEGTFRKYHTEFSLPNADKFLQEASKASLQLMTDGPYHIYKSTPDKAYQELFIALTPITDEVILAQQYSAALQVYQNVNYYTLVPSQGKPGLEKDVINSYLMKDGSRFTDIPDYDKMQFFEEMQNRDPRLSQTVRAPGYTRIGSTVKRVPDFGATVTGYQPIKYITEELYDSSNKSINAIPVFRYAEALLNYAEAQAELNQITQADLDKSINLIRDRVAMPHLNMASANTSPDPYLAKQYTHVNGANMGVMLEIRRERRLELVMENYRWDDLMRWKEGHLLARQYKGMYFPGLGKFDFDHDGITDAVIYDGTKPAPSGPQYFKINADIVLQNNTNGGPMLVNPQIPKTFNETRDYLYPIPVQEILLNPDLTQNPNWK